ncbi:MAG: hypothetical protein WCP45_11160 [Verrucomicrobiota bacterium]
MYLGLHAAAAGAEIAVSQVPAAIAIRQDASALEVLAANEVRRYVYLRTGALLPVARGQGGSDRIVVARKDRGFCGDLGQELAPQQFVLKTGMVDGKKVWSIVGGDEVGTLYGAYRFAEKLGVRFGLDEDVVPDARLSGAWPEPDETGKPRFALRGLQPFHDFNVGPDWWNAQDYQNVLTQMAKLRLNFIGFHTYPSWNPSSGPEANVWIGLPEDVDADGNVRFGYEAGVVTTRKGWNVTPYPTGKYAAGAGLLFENDEYGPDFMLDCLEWPKTGDAGAAMFNRYGDMQKRAFGQARQLGIKTCVGTELPLGVPKLLASRLADKGLKPEDPAVIRRLYEGTFLRLMRKMQPDYYGFCAPETWLDMAPGCSGWEITTTANVERDMNLAEAVLESVQAPFGLATTGWRLGTRDNPLWMDQRAPRSWAISSINTRLGNDPVEKHYGTISGRPKWVIGWAEDDGTAGAHCCTCWDLQLWVKRLFADSADASRYGAEGMMAIHWRTSAISPNISALSRGGWDFDRADPMPTVDVFWADWGHGMFGGDAGAGAGRLIQQFDGGHLGINALIQGGAKTTDIGITGFFAPLQALEALRPQIHGTGNLERFDYWLNQIRATHLRVRTWVLADRLTGKIGQANKIVDAEKRRDFAMQEILPLRLEIARSYEAMIAAFLRCAKSPGEVGTIASIESGNRERIVAAHDAALANMLATSLPAEAAPGTTYHGDPRIFVASTHTRMNAGEPQEIRAFVLSAVKCAGVTLHYRALGEGPFKQVAATHRARQAYRVALPAQTEGTFEYYLEAVLDDGRKVRWPVTAPALNQTTLVW